MCSTYAGGYAVNRVYKTVITYYLLLIIYICNNNKLC